MNSAIANSFFLNSPNNALGFYFLILFPEAGGFLLRSPIKPLFLSIAKNQGNGAIAK
jgi:hypothetical protein